MSQEPRIDGGLPAWDVAERYLSDWSGMRRGIPAELHRPRSTDEVASLLRRCSAEGRSVTVQGGLTGLVGGAVPADNDIVINMERMDAIEHVDLLEGIMIVQAGATLERVQLAALAAGWVFPLDLGARASCQMGGNAATNAGGNRVVRYGTMRDRVLGLEAVLSDGTVMDSLNRLIKNSSGLDPRHLFIGSEGTLGVITRLVLKLEPPMAAPSVAFVALRDFADASTLLSLLKRSLGSSLSAFEFMSCEFAELAAALTGSPIPLHGQAEMFALVEVSGTNEQHEAHKLQQCMEKALEAKVLLECLVSKSLADATAFWRVRESIPELISHLRPCVNFDCGLPWSETAGFIDRVNRLLSDRYPEATHLFFGHLGDNNIHLMTGPHHEHDVASVDHLVYGELKDRHATISAEHGIGFLKKEYLAHTKTCSEIEVMRRVKRALDPLQILNRGRVLD